MKLKWEGYKMKRFNMQYKRDKIANIKRFIRLYYITNKSKYYPIWHITSR